MENVNNNGSSNLNWLIPNTKSMGQGIARVSKYALPLVLAGAVASLPGAEAGPVTYATCVAACQALATVGTGGPGAALIMQCIQGCYITLGPWCP